VNVVLKRYAEPEGRKKKINQQRDPYGAKKKKD